MSDFFDKEQTPNEQLPADATVSEDAQDIDYSEAESTVFSAPVEHKNKNVKKGSTKRIVSIVAAVVAVAVLVGGTLAIIKLIPEMKGDETVSTIFDENITVIESDSSKFTNVTVKNKNGEFKLLTQEVATTNDDGETETSEYWTVEGVEASKLSSTSMDQLISSAASVSATREIDKPASECGFDEPKIKVSVKSNDGSDYTFTVGNESPDGLGYYLTVEGKDTVYIAPETEIADFDFSLLDLSDTSPIPATIFSTDTSENKVEDGTYAYFDSLTFSGKLYPENLTIVTNKEESEITSLLPYMITSPMNRYATTEPLSCPVNLFSASVTVAGNYALEVTDETLKLFGLDDPDVVLTMTINGESKYFKISQVEDGYCAVVYDGATMIRKVDSSTFEFLQLSAKDFYYKSLFIYSINDIKNLTLKDGEGETKFDISYEEDDNENKTYHISANGKELTASNFQDFYKDFVCIQCSSFDVEEISAEPDGVVTFTFHNGEESVVKFYKVNETEYQYSINGAVMGKITSSSYNKMVKNIRLVAEDKEST